MTLKEKFSLVLMEFWTSDWEGKCEQVAEEFAIGFAEFIEGTYSYSNIFDHWYLHADTSKTYNKKELFEIYKKEKGL